MPHEKFIKYGGVKFTNNTSPEEINLFVRNLPSELLREAAVGNIAQWAQA